MAPHRDARNRRHCLRKKANEYYQKFNADAAVIIKDQDTFYTYSSPGFLAEFMNSLPVPSENRSGPDNFDTVRQRNQLRNSTSSSVSLSNSGFSPAPSPIPAPPPIFAYSTPPAPGRLPPCPLIESPTLSFRSLFGSSPTSDASTPAPDFPMLVPSASGSTTPRGPMAEKPSSATYTFGTIDPAYLEKPQIGGPQTPRRPPALRMRSPGVPPKWKRNDAKRQHFRREYFK